MKYKAVIFDLFGTLTSNFSSQGYNNALNEMAKALSVPFDNFRQAWFSTSKERNTSTSQNCESDVENICRALDILVSKEQVLLAVEARLDYIQHVMTPQPKAVEVLSRLKEEGCKTGLLSNCSHEIPVVWSENPIASLVDVAVFSCSVGMKKPDPQIYQLTTERLRIRPEECLFIGDGGSEELSGALSVGMNPFLFRPDADSTEQHLMNRERWEGPIISSLAEVLELVR